MENGCESQLTLNEQRNEKLGLELNVKMVPLADSKTSLVRNVSTSFTSMDTDTIKSVYEEVRSDNSETEWAVFKFDNSKIIFSAKGKGFKEFKEQFSEDERGFGYIRLQTGDEMSKRQKFLFLTWIGSNVSVIKRAKMSIDKAIMKSILCNFAVELQLENLQEIDLNFFVDELRKVGGADYGTGIREN